MKADTARLAGAVPTLPAPAFSAVGAPTGEDVYRARCAGCRDQASDRVPAKTALQNRPASRTDTARDFVAVDGAKAHGGSIDGPRAVGANGMAFVNSGYPRNGAMPGNVLPAFAAEQQFQVFGN